MGVDGITYVARLPPSPSGVALYSSTFLSVLDMVAPTRVVALPSQPEESQRLAVLASTLVRTLRVSRARTGHVVSMELAGRGLAEFWTAVFISCPPWRRRLWVTVHDTPAVSGGAFFFAVLDRRGCRRVAALLSRRLGTRAERSLLQRAERVHCLSASGAGQLASTFRLTRPVRTLPHVATASASPVGSRRSIFLPGYLDGVDNIDPVLLALAGASTDWRVEVGACGEGTARAVRARALALGIQARVELLGYLDEGALHCAFERAAVVVRWKRSGWGGTTRAGGAAVSGPLIYAMAHGCSIVTNDTRGIVDCLPVVQAIRAGSGAEGAEQCQCAVAALLGDRARREAIAAATRAHITLEHGPLAVAKRLLED